MRIDYDRAGVPHIEASTDADAFAALGVCHALDRAFQMDLLRHVLSGRLSELVGEKPLGANPHPPFLGARTSLHADQLLRVLGLRRAAQAVWDEADAPSRRLLRAYVGGVNAAFLGPLRRNRPLEHRILRTRLRPWTPVDAILMAKGMSLGLSFIWRTTPVFAAIAERLRGLPEHLAALMPQPPAKDARALLTCVRDTAGELLAYLPTATPPAGSNAMVVGASRSATGLPLLASDPHLGLSFPSVWYLASVRGASVRAVGATLPGLPGVVLGRNEHLAWGLTNAMLDDGDLWWEDVDDHGATYRVDGRQRPLVVRSETLRTRGGAPRVVRVRHTHRGPLLTDAFPGYTGRAASLRLVLHTPTPDLQCFLGLVQATSVAEAQAAMEPFGSPAQNLVLADNQGASAYRMIGKVPERPPGYSPGLPLDGTRSDTDWLGWVGSEAIPQAGVPADTVFVTANDPHVAAPLPFHLSHLYEPSYRAERIRARLRAPDQLRAEDLRAAQLDVLDLAFVRFREAVLLPYVEGVRASRPHVGPLVDRLMTWDGQETPSARGAVVWHLLYHHLIRQVFSARLGEPLTTRWMSQVNVVDEALHRAFADETSPWAPPHQREALLARAFDDVHRDLRVRGWTADVSWGTFHTLTLRHALAGVPWIGEAFRRPALPMRGGPYTVHSGQYDHGAPGPMGVGPSYRHVVDLAQPGRSRMITYGGQSGNPGSPHYDDLTARWCANRGLPMRLARPAHCERTLMLRPGG